MSVQSKVSPKLEATAWAQGPGRLIWKRGQFRLQEGVLSFTDEAGQRWFAVKTKDAQPEFPGGPLHEILVQLFLPHASLEEKNERSSRQFLETPLTPHDGGDAPETSLRRSDDFGM